jgi:hypothetical protein
VPQRTMRTLDDVRAALTTRLGSNALSLGSISTRVLLRTGASLKAPRPDQNTDSALVATVMEILAEMGYEL